MSDKKSIPNYSFNSIDIISYINKRKKPLAIITIIAIIISIIVSYTIDERYKSTVILFPVSSSSISEALFSESLASKDILKFGEEEEVEQLLQILHSNEIRKRIIAKYDLMKHYEIEPDSKYPKTQLYKQFKENISFTQTKFMAIEIDVLDTEPQMAADIANDIADLLDTTINLMQKERANKALAIVENEYLALKKYVNFLEDSLKKIRNKGIQDYESQSEVFNDAYATAIAQGRLNSAKQLEDKIKILADYGGNYVLIRDMLVHEVKKLSELKAKYMEAKVDAEQNLPNTFIVNNAIKAEKKSYPIKWLIVTISTISSFILALLLLIIFDNVLPKADPPLAKKKN